MNEIRQQKKNKKKAFAPWVPALLLIFCALTFRGVWNIFLKNKESTANLSHVENEVQTLSERKALLEKQVTALRTNEGVEAEIRSRFQVSKEGEKVIIFDAESNDTEIQATSSPGFFERIWIKIKGFF